MSKTIVVLIALVAIMTQSAYAADAQSEIGRYQVIVTDAVKINYRMVIKWDTTTGKTWFLNSGGGQAKLIPKDHHWVEIEESGK